MFRARLFTCALMVVLWAGGWLDLHAFDDKGLPPGGSTLSLSRSLGHECSCEGQEGAAVSVFFEGFFTVPEAILSLDPETSCPHEYLIIQNDRVRPVWLSGDGTYAEVRADSSYAFDYAIGAIRVPPAFTGDVDRTLVSGWFSRFATSAGLGTRLNYQNDDGTVTPFSILPDHAYDLAYVSPDSTSGYANTVLTVDPSANALFSVRGDGSHTRVAAADGLLYAPFSLAIVPDSFGNFDNHVILGAVTWGRLTALDLLSGEVRPFTIVHESFDDDEVGLRQIAFSPVGWGALFDPALHNERVLLVSMAVGGGEFGDFGLVQMIDARGHLVAELRNGLNDEPYFNPRGMTFRGCDMLLNDLASGHVLRVTPSAFVAPDCNGNGRTDRLDIAPPYSLEDANDNGIPDECEPDLDLDGTANSIDLCPLSPSDGVAAQFDGRPVGDANGDCLRTTADWPLLTECLDNSGPGGNYYLFTCLHPFRSQAPIQDDGDVDLADIASFLNRLDATLP